MTSSRFVVAALVGWLFVGLLSAAPQFVPGPSARYNTCAVYDEARQVVVVYGGGPGTWEFDGVSWTQASAVAPPSGHESHAMVYDSQRQKIVVFGGYSGGLLDDTWEFDGFSWTAVSTQHRPPARYLHAMAYDSARGRVVVFGGTTGGNNAIGDTWEYDGADWTEVTPASGSPSARWSVHAAYDSTRGKVVLFGGTNGNDETWEWDGAAWSQIATATPAPGRSAHAMVYDNVRGKTVMWGGNGGGNETWEYDGVDWHSVVSSYPPSNRFGHGMAYDSARQEVVLFGGNGGGVLDDTWSYDGVEWRPALDYVTSPINGNRYALTPTMTWTDAEAFAVLQGGHLATVRNSAENAWLASTFSSGSVVPWIGLNDAQTEGVFEWSSGEPVSFTAWLPSEPSNGNGAEDWVHFGAPWNGPQYSDGWNDLPNNASQNGVPCLGIVELLGGPVGEVAAGVASAVAPQPLRAHSTAGLPVGGSLAFGGELAGGPFFSTYEWTNSGWNKQFSVLNPMPRTGHSLILDEASQNNVLFGGVNPGGSKLSETWSYQGGQWTYLTPANAPSARSEHAMAFDLASNVGVLFGGEDATGTLLNDMWAWDGIDWSQATPATLPPARAGHGLAYDRYRSRLVLFGGTDGSARLNDIWEWDGADWTQMTPAQPNGVAYGPSGRDGFVTAYDPRSERVVVIGGETDNGCVDEVWSWDGAGWLRHLPASGSTLPSARKDAAIFVDAATNDLRMFGGGCGSEFSDELWELQLPVFARSEVIGVGCLGSNGVPALSIANGTAPVLGAQMDFVYDNALNSIFVTPAIVAVGFDQGTYQGIPLPLSLAVIGLPGCTLYHSNDLSFSVGVAAGAAQFTWPLTIPNDTTLLGKDVFVQGLHLEFPGSASWAAMSNAIGIRIGDQ